MLLDMETMGRNGPKGHIIYQQIYGSIPDLQRPMETLFLRAIPINIKQNI